MENSRELKALIRNNAHVFWSGYTHPMLQDLRQYQRFHTA